MDREQLRGAFEDPAPFTTSPLYRSLSQTVADHDLLLDLASRGRPGQYPTFLFFGAVHHLLLRGADHPLARFYPSIAGDAALPPAGAGPVLVSFCGEFEAELAETISSRLVQTSQVQRAFGLRLGLSMIACDVPGPVHLIEVGASAGLNLRFRSYGYQVGGRQFGDPAAAVQLAADRCGAGLLPDLDVLPPVAGVLGVDLNPLDVTSDDDVRWLQCLVWPGEAGRLERLSAAVETARRDPPPVYRGDLLTDVPALVGQAPRGVTVVLYHSAVLWYVSCAQRAEFAAAVAGLGVVWLANEGPGVVPGITVPDAGLNAYVLARNGTEAIAVDDSHGLWVEWLP